MTIIRFYGKTGTVSISSRSLINRSLERALDGTGVGPDLASELAGLGPEDRWDLFAAANRVRQFHRGDKADLCSIINAKSGACSEDCSFCAQSARHKTGAPVYPLIPLEQMKRAAENAARNGARRFCIVTSGRGIEGRDDLKNIAQGVRAVRAHGLSPCATLGTLTRDQLAFLKDAGLDRYHHNIETSQEFFPRICTTHSFEERKEVLHHARTAGLTLCSGGILGMGESMQDRVSMALTLRELDVDSVPLNFLMPITGTPLGTLPPLAPLEALHSIALFRMVLPKKEIRICGGRATALGRLHPLIFMAGADGFLIGNYLTTVGRDPADDLATIRDLGLSI